MSREAKLQLSENARFQGVEAVFDQVRHECYRQSKSRFGW
jgi:hypothetical protein